MANSFLGAQGMDMKASLSEPDLFETARQIMTIAEEAGCEIIIPTDGLAASEFVENATHRAILNEEIADGEDDAFDFSLDRNLFKMRLLLLKRRKRYCGMVRWAPLNKPLTMRQLPCASSSSPDTKGAVVSVAGGGDTVAALNVAGVAGEFSYLSLAGGAFLEWLEGENIARVAALQTK